MALRDEFVELGVRAARAAEKVDQLIASRSPTDVTRSRSRSPLKQEEPKKRSRSEIEEEERPLDVRRTINVVGTYRDIWALNEAERLALFERYGRVKRLSDPRQTRSWDWCFTVEFESLEGYDECLAHGKDIAQQTRLTCKPHTGR